MLHLRLGRLLHLASICVTFTVGITFSVVITFSSDTTFNTKIASGVTVSFVLVRVGLAMCWS